MIKFTGFSQHAFSYAKNNSLCSSRVFRYSRTHIDNILLLALLSRNFDFVRTCPLAFSCDNYDYWSRWMKNLVDDQSHFVLFYWFGLFYFFNQTPTTRISWFAVVGSIFCPPCCLIALTRRASWNVLLGILFKILRWPHCKRKPKDNLRTQLR